jgi:hypothetical protein
MDNGSRLSKSLLSCRPLRAEGEAAAFHKMFALPFAKGEVKFIRKRRKGRRSARSIFAQPSLFVRAFG